jgi:hypothetical protein
VRIIRGKKVAFVGEAVTDANGLAVFDIVKAGKGSYVTTVVGLIAPTFEWDGVTPDNSFVK